MHTDYTMLMSLLLDGEATQADERRLREHLRTCATCAGVWQRWQAVDRRLAAAPFMAPALDLTDKIMAGIDSQKSRRGRNRWLGSGLLASWFALSLIGTVVVGMLVYWALQNPQQASGILFTVLRGVNVATWILLGFLRLLGGIGAPTLAAGVGFLATVTCLLSMLWLWVVGRSHAWLRGPLPQPQSSGLRA